MNQKVWQATGHVDHFLIRLLNVKMQTVVFVQTSLKYYHQKVSVQNVGEFGEVRQFNMMLETKVWSG